MKKGFEGAIKDGISKALKKGAEEEKKNAGKKDKPCKPDGACDTGLKCAKVVA